MPKANQFILDIKPYKGGKSTLNGQQEVIKLSSNENCFGCSENAKQLYKNASDSLHLYPDGSCSALADEIAKKYNIDANKIVFGAGSDEIITLLVGSFAQKDDEIIYSKHGFLMYRIAAQRIGARPIAANEINLKTNIDAILKKINNKTKIIFIANPNNPTGSYVSREEIVRLMDNCPKDILVVLDMAYAEYVEESDYSNGIELVEKYPNLVMMRTFSKIHGLAALRLGWSYQSDYISDILNRYRGPFNVSAPAQAAGIGAIGDDDFVAKSKNHNNKWLQIFYEELQEIGLNYYPSYGNFILIKFKDENQAVNANKFLEENGIIIRKTVAYHLPDCLRATVGTSEQNKLLIETLNKFISS